MPWRWKTKRERSIETNSQFNTFSFRLKNQFPKDVLLLVLFFFFFFFFFNIKGGNHVTVYISYGVNKVGIDLTVYHMR